MRLPAILVLIATASGALADELPASVDRAIERYEGNIAKVLRDAEKTTESLFAALRTQRATALRRGDAKGVAAIDALVSRAEAQIKEISAAIKPIASNDNENGGPVIAADPIEKYLKGCQDQDDYDLVIYAFIGTAVPNQYLTLSLNANHRFGEQIQVRGDWQWDEVMSNEDSFYWNNLFPGVIHKAREDYYQRPRNVAECAFANSRAVKLKITDIQTEKGYSDLMRSARVLILCNQPQRLQVICECKSLVKHPTPIK